MEVIVRKLAEKAPLVRPADEATQSYGSKMWWILNPEGPTELLYNLGRQRFEIAEYGYWLKTFLGGHVDEKPMREVLRTSMTIKRNYGLSVGVMYFWKHSMSRLEDKITAAAEFIYFKVPYSEHIPGLEKLSGWGPLDD